MATVSNKSEATCEQVYRLLKKLTKDNPVTIPKCPLAAYYAHKHARDRGMRYKITSGVVSLVKGVDTNKRELLRRQIIQGKIAWLK